MRKRVPAEPQDASDSFVFPETVPLKPVSSGHAPAHAIIFTMHWKGKKPGLKARVKAKKVKPPKPGKASVYLPEFPDSMPALARAQRITERASDLGFDWPDSDPVWRKLDEELSELRAAVASEDNVRIGEELGDLFFSLVNLSRFLQLEAEEVLAGAVNRFIRRFAHIEKRIKEQGKNLTESTLEEMDLYWEEAKKMER